MELHDILIEVFSAYAHYIGSEKALKTLALLIDEFKARYQQ